MHRRGSANGSILAQAGGAAKHLYPRRGWSLNGSLGKYSAFFQDPKHLSDSRQRMDTQCDPENSPGSSSRGKIKKILIVLPYL